MVPDAGLTVTLMAGFNVTVAVPIFVGSAELRIETITVCGELTVAGAVYSPIPEMEPIAGLIDQLPDVFEVPVTVAANCWVWPAVRDTDEGLIVTFTEEADGFRVIVAVPTVPSTTLVARTVTV